MAAIVDLKKARREFYRHRCGAERRGIGFELTLEEWCKIWENSGHYADRGSRKNQYGMQRFLDLGPYAVGNVEIGHPYDNSRTRAIRNSFRNVGRKRTLKAVYVPYHAIPKPFRYCSPEEILIEEEETI